MSLVGIIKTFYLFQIVNMEEAEDDDSSNQASFVKNLKKLLDKKSKNTCVLFELLKLAQKFGP